MSKTFNFKIFLSLLAISIISVVSVFPYILTVQGEVIAKSGVSLPLLFTVQIIQSMILFSVCIILGLYFAYHIKFHLPLLEALFKKGNPKNVLKKIAGISVIMGISSAITIYALDYLFTAFGVSLSTHQIYAPAWQTLLASLYGGVTEEIIMRLFLMSFFIWLSLKITRSSTPSTASIFFSILLAAVIFGLGHLPITASLTQLNTMVITRAVVLNGVGGIVFGWLYWKKGLESAMIAHFTTDIFLLTLLPQLLR